MYVADFADNEALVAWRLRHVRDGANKALSRAANRTISHANKTITQKTMKRYYVRKSDIEKGKKKPKRATIANPTAELTYESGFLNLAEWGGSKTATVTPKKVSTFASHPKVYKGRAIRGSGFKAFNGEIKAFRKPGGNAKGNLYVRRSTATGDPDIRGVAGPAYTQVMKNKAVIEPWRDDVHVWFQKRLEHEVTNLLRGK